MAQKYKIKVGPEPIDERLQGVVYVREVLLSQAVAELEDKELVKVGKPGDSEKHVYVRDETTGKIYEVREDMLEEV